MEQQQLEEQKKKEKLERKKESLKVTKDKNSIDASEENAVIKRREEEKMNHTIFQRSCQKRKFCLWPRKIKRRMRMRAPLLICV